MKKSIATIGLILSLSIITNSQSKLQIASMGACVGGKTLDIISSQNLYENNSFFRNSQERIDNRKALLSYIPCGASIILDKNHHSKAGNIFRFIYGGLSTTFAIHNFSVKINF